LFARQSSCRIADRSAWSVNKLRFYACDEIGTRTKQSVEGRRNSFIAREGMPFILVSVAAVVACLQWVGIVYTLIPLAFVVYFYLIFRDPIRAVPAAPLGVISPVDGYVVAVGMTGEGARAGETQKIILRIDSWGTYTARCPVEGKILDMNCVSSNGNIPRDVSGLWVRTDEGDDVVLHFSGHRFGLVPRSFFQFGDRVGQGQRCAYLRLTQLAEVELPLDARIMVSTGQRVSAGSDVLAKLPHH
jgi:phosphatidylserine decarboxylase